MDLKATAEAGGCKESFKNPLTCIPFVYTFEYGDDSDSYWNYKNMLLHLEDCVDVFLFDHSSSHDEQREDGLNIKKDKRFWWYTEKNEKHID